MVSAKHLYEFIIHQPLGDKPDIISIFNGKLLISQRFISYVLIYRQNGSHLLTHSTSKNEWLMDATWTPQGYILYVIANNNNVVRMDENGKAKRSSILGYPTSLTVSDDNIVYLASVQNTGVFRSLDDGVIWTSVLKLTNDWGIWQMIKVASHKGDELWTKLEDSSQHIYQLRSYKLINGDIPDDGIWKEINISLFQLDSNSILPKCKFAYDSNMNIIISAGYLKTVYAFSMFSENVYKLLSSDHIKHEPKNIIVDRKNLMMYILQNKNTIEVFQLLYEYQI